MGIVLFLSSVYFSVPQNKQITEIYKYSAQQSSHPCLSVLNAAYFLLAVEVETIFKTVKILQVLSLNNNYSAIGRDKCSLFSLLIFC